jgi:leukotriene-A4 hydrolase
MRRFLPIAASLVLVLVLPVEAQRRRAAHYPVHAPPPPLDIYSASRPAEVRTTHLGLELDVDFTRREIRGTATHEIANFTGARKFIVDTRSLTIRSVTVDGRPATYTHVSVPTALGQPLTIDIEPTSRVVRIAYTTTAVGRALNWLTARQTLGNTAPFLFTQVQPDRAREWMPVQDTPGVRMTYEATVRVPPGMLALMSAPNPRAPSADGTYVFRMGRAIPAYLIALAAGRVEFRELDERTGIYAEPPLADDAVWDLQLIPAMVDTGERILGTYPFDRYDIVLIPGFTAGGMENPELNFINAGLVTGNRDPQPLPNSVIAHEIAHSWGGDLATCATWSDIWLNEGFATYFQKRIEEELIDAELSELGYFFDRRSYNDFMTATVRSPHLQVLHREFRPGDTLSVFSTTNYQKGSLFLKTLDDRLGRPAFDAFLRDYFARFAFRWVDVNSFLDALGPVDPALLVDQWLFSPGLPANVTAPERARIWDRVAVQANAYRNGASPASLDTTGWRSLERGLFLWQINDVITRDMPGLDAKFGYSQMNRPPMEWLIATCATLYQPGMPAVERFLMLNLFDVVALYDRLSKTSAGRTWAVAFYKTARERYSPGTQTYVDGIIGRPPG